MERLKHDKPILQNNDGRTNVKRSLTDDFIECYENGISLTKNDNFVNNNKAIDQSKFHITSEAHKQYLLSNRLQSDVTFYNDQIETKVSEAHSVSINSGNCQNQRDVSINGDTKTGCESGNQHIIESLRSNNSIFSTKTSGIKQAVNYVDISKHHPISSSTNPSDRNHFHNSNGIDLSNSVATLNKANLGGVFDNKSKQIPNQRRLLDTNKQSKPDSKFNVGEFESRKIERDLIFTKRTQVYQREIENPDFMSTNDTTNSRYEETNELTQQYPIAYNDTEDNTEDLTQQQHTTDFETFDDLDVDGQFFYAESDEIESEYRPRKSSCLSCSVCSNKIDTKRNEDGGFPLRKAASCSICAWDIDELNESFGSEEENEDFRDEEGDRDNNRAETEVDPRNESRGSTRQRSNSYTKAMEDEIDDNDFLNNSSFANDSIRLPPEGGEYVEDIVEQETNVIPRSSSPKTDKRSKLKKRQSSLDKKVSDELDEIFGKLHRSPQQSFDDDDEDANGNRKKPNKNVMFKSLIRTPSFMRRNKNRLKAGSKSRSVEQLYRSDDALTNYNMKRSISHMDVYHFTEEDEEEENEQVNAHINEAFIEYLNTINGTILLGGNSNLRYIWHQISSYQSDLMGPFDDFLKWIIEEIQQTYKKCQDLESALSLKVQQQEKETAKIYDDAELAMKQERERMEEKHLEKDEHLKREYSNVIKSKDQELEELYKNNCILAEKNENLNVENNTLKHLKIKLDEQNYGLMENEMELNDRIEAIKKENTILNERNKTDQENIQQLQIQLFQTTTMTNEIQDKYDKLILKLRDLNEEKEILEASCTNLTTDLEELKMKRRLGEGRSLAGQQFNWSTNSSFDYERTSESFDGKQEMNDNNYDHEDEDMNHNHDVIDSMGRHSSQSSTTDSTHCHLQNHSITNSMTYNKATDSVLLITKPLPPSYRPLSTSSPVNVIPDIDERNRYIQTPSGFTPIRNRDTSTPHLVTNSTQINNNNIPHPSMNLSKKRLHFNNQTPIRLASSRQPTEFKVIFTGDPNVGKTSLIRRICHGRFKEKRDVTIDTDCSTKVITCNDRKVTLKLWDTVGTEKFNSIPPSYFRNSDIVILVYDLMDEETFWNAKKWLRQIHDYTNEDIFLFLVGNKVDFDHKRKIAPKRGECLATENDAMFIETSAKTGENTEQLCNMIATTLLEREETVFIRNDFESSLCSLTYSFKRSNDISICCN